MLSRERLAWVVVLVGSLIIAVLSARPYAGSWNDGSRLASVEALVDHGTLAVDQTIFVQSHLQPSPYPLDDELLQRFGTKDKLFINGHYYSDKSPIPSFGMAGVYQTWRWLGGPSASERPDLFCLLMTFTFSGIAYVIAVGCLFAIVRHVGLGLGASSAVTALFALGTVALPYAQHVNNHILLLAVAAIMFLHLLHAEQSGWTIGKSLGIGTLLGMGYTIDLAAGPMLAFAMGILALSRERLGFTILGALPWVIAHHIVNYQIGGTIGPANAVPEYFEWPGSPFNASNMTGGWVHASIFKASFYALDMLFGHKGFLGHNLILFLPLVMLQRLFRASYRERPIILTGLYWCVGTWLLYAATSKNLSGGCCSIRWLVPLLIPGFTALAVVLRDYPSTKVDALILGTGSIMLGMGMAVRGPWYMKHMPFYVIIYITTLVIAIGYRVWVRRRTAERKWRDAAEAECRNVGPRWLHTALLRSFLRFAKKGSGVKPPPSKNLSTDFANPTPPTANNG